MSARSGLTAFFARLHFSKSAQSATSSERGISARGILLCGRERGH